MLYFDVLKQDDFSGGLVTRGSPLGLKPSQSPDCLNIHSDLFKTGKRRLGYTKLNSVSQVSTANGLYNYVKTDSVQYLVALWGLTLKKMDVSVGAWDGTFDTIPVDPAKGTQLSDNIMYNTSFLSSLIITTEARDVPQAWNPDNGAGYMDIDWQNSHAAVTGNAATFTGQAGDILKITIDGTAFDTIDISSATTIANVVTLINAFSGLSAKGFAVASPSTYLQVYSNTRGSGGTVKIENGTGSGRDTVAVLFAASPETSLTIVDVNNAPNAKYLQVWQNTVWIANSSAYPDRVFYSAPSDMTTWASTNPALPTYFDIITPGDVGITGLAILAGRLYVFKKFSIHRVTYLGGTPLLDIKQVKSSTGTSSPRSICNIETPSAGEILEFLGSDLQIYKFDGYNTLPASEAVFTYNGISNYCLIGDNLTYGVNSNYLINVHASNYTKKHWFSLYFPLGASTVPSDSLSFDYYAEAFFPMHFENSFACSCIADNGSGQRKLYVAGTNYAWLTDTGNSDDGTAITWYWSSPKMDFTSEVQLKSMRNMNLTTTSNATATPLFQYRVGWSSTYSTGTTIPVNTTVSTFDMPNLNELYQWKVGETSTADPFELVRATFVGEKLGVGR